MTILVHIISISLLMMALDSLWQLTMTSRARGKFFDTAFKKATDSKIESQSGETIGLYSKWDDSVQIIYDPKTKARFKSRIQGDFFHRGKK
jgi:hypothetical protein